MFVELWSFVYGGNQSESCAAAPLCLSVRGGTVPSVAVHSHMLGRGAEGAEVQPT